MAENVFDLCQKKTVKIARHSRSQPVTDAMATSPLISRVIRDLAQPSLWFSADFWCLFPFFRAQRVAICTLFDAAAVSPSQLVPAWRGSCCLPSLLSLFIYVFIAVKLLHICKNGHGSAPGLSRLQLSCQFSVDHFGIFGKLYQSRSNGS